MARHATSVREITPALRAAGSGAVRPPNGALGDGTALRPLARDLIIVLVVKAVVLCAIWFAFFRTPVAQHMTMDPGKVVQQVAGPGAHPERAHAVH